MNLKNLLKTLTYSIIIVLFLEVLQLIFRKQGSGISFYILTIITATEFLIILFVLYALVLKTIFRKRGNNGISNRAIVSTFLVLMIVMEGVATAGLRHPSKIPGVFLEAYKSHYEKYIRNIVTYDYKNTNYSPDYFYMLKPNITFNFTNIEFNTPIITNSRGLRDDELSLKSPEIICLGDSYTFGWGVQQDKSFPGILEKMTGKKVLNTGVSSFGTARELKLFNSLDTSNLQYLIIQYCGNDGAENVQLVKDNYNLKISDASKFDSTVNFHNWSKKYFPFKNSLLIGQRCTKNFLRGVYASFRKKKNTSSTDEDAKLFLTIIKNSKLNLEKYKLIVTCLDNQMGNPNGFFKSMNMLLKTTEFQNLEGKVYTLDPSNKLEKDDYFILDPHANEKGHYKVASLLAKFIN